jgi:dCTP diphosphatase
MNPDSVADLTSEVLRFREERNWKQFHNPKDMALSLCLEVAELLELMQWRNGEELETHLAERRVEVGEELSDILYWTLLIAHDLRVNLPAAFMDKIALNAMKYPVEKAAGSSAKYTELDRG